MLGVLLLVMQTGLAGTAPPVFSEGWVMPTEIGGQASAVCPVTGRFTAEFTALPSMNVKVRGLGRSSTPQDEMAIRQMLNPRRVIRFIEMSCWGHQGGQISIHYGDDDGRTSHSVVNILWVKDGPHLISADALYPSAP